MDIGKSNTNALMGKTYINNGSYIHDSYGVLDKYCVTSDWLEHKIGLSSELGFPRSARAHLFSMGIDLDPIDTAMYHISGHILEGYSLKFRLEK